MHEPLGEVGPHSQVRNPLEPERFPHRCMAELGFQPRPLSGSRPSADLLTLAGLGGWDAPAVLRKPEVPLGREHVLSREQQQETVWGWEECVLCPRPLLRALAALTVLGFFFFSFPFQSSSGATQEKKGRPLAHLLCVQCLDLLAGEMVQCGVKHVGSGAWQPRYESWLQHVPMV